MTFKFSEKSRSKGSRIRRLRRWLRRRQDKLELKRTRVRDASLVLDSCPQGPTHLCYAPSPLSFPSDIPACCDEQDTALCVGAIPCPTNRLLAAVAIIALLKLMRALPRPR
jgi:hypothetical protein